MALFLASNAALFSRNPAAGHRQYRHRSFPPKRLSFPGDSKRTTAPRPVGSLRPENPTSGIPDAWGDRDELEPDVPPAADPVLSDDEWGSDTARGYNVSASAGYGEDGVGDLKRCLVDSFYGTELGLKASPEVRAEVLELVNQLEAKNPTPAPTEALEVFDGNWILLYTAFSELLPLLAVGSTPLLKVEKISQVIDAKKSNILNVVTLSNLLATFSFSASASFEIRSPSRIQVQFIEGIFEPPVISSTVNLPENVDVFGQKIDLLPVQGALNPVQQAVANITRGISGQSPLKVPIPGEKSSSWLLTTFLDDDLRISRGDGGLFVLVKEGSPLLDLS